MARLNYREISRALAYREPFQGNSMWAEYVPVGKRPWVGQLPNYDRDYLMADLHTAETQGLPFYVVYSYETPIAWAYGCTVRVPEVKYSVTTSKQQTYARAYLTAA